MRKLITKRKVVRRGQLLEGTVKFHRGNIMRKMCADSLADLVRMAGNPRISHERPSRPNRIALRVTRLNLDHHQGVVDLFSPLCEKSSVIMSPPMSPLIAIVDDDISVRTSLDRLIRSVHFEVRTFASAEEFLNSAEPRKPDCLILDVRLPGMSGIELYRHLLAQKSTVPVIFITAHGSDDLAKLSAASDRPVAYFIKPFSGDELVDAVAVALKRAPGG